MEESSVESRAEMYEEHLVPKELFYRVLEKDPLVEEKWSKLLPHLKNLKNVDNKITISHAIGVSRIAVGFFDFITSSEENLEHYMDIGRVRDIIDLGARLHDIGKGALLEDGSFKYRDILLSDKKLSPQEQELIDGHSTDGADILRDIGMPEDIIRIANEHHNKEERSVWHLPTEIITIADVLESVTSTKRRYITNPYTKKDAFFLVMHTVLQRFGGKRIQQLYNLWEPVYEQGAII